VFVHATGLNDEIRENDSVSFEVTEGKKGLNAVNVKVI
jgi:CspA family cold shock protein